MSTFGERAREKWNIIRVDQAGQREDEAGLREERDIEREDRDIVRHDQAVAREEVAVARDVAAKYRSKVTRSDVAALAVEVGRLGSNVQELHDLLLKTLVKTNSAFSMAAQAPSREELDHRQENVISDIRTERKRALLRVYVAETLVAILLFLVAGMGALFISQNRSFRNSQYELCRGRTAQSQALATQAKSNQTFIVVILEIEKRAAARGDKNAQELEQAFQQQINNNPVQTPQVVDCTKILPHGLLS